MKRTIGLLTSGAIALGLISIQCSSSTEDDSGNPSAGTGAGGGPVVAGAPGGSGSPGVSGGGTGPLPSGGAGSGGTGLVAGGGPAGGPSVGGAGKGGSSPGGAPGTSGGGAGGTAGGAPGSGGKAGGAGGSTGGASGGSGGGSAGGGAVDAPPFSDVAMLLNSRCATAACHGAQQPNHNVLANNDGLHGRLLANMAQGDCKQTPLVIPNNPDDSFLIKVLKGTAMCGSETINRMPNMCGGGGNACFTEAQIKLISDWIAAGAPED